MDEIWKAIPGCEGLDEVSNLGRAKSLERKVWIGRAYKVVPERILKLGLDRDGYALARSLRAHPGSLDSWRGICSKSPEHDADHGEADECSNGRCVAFEVASQATVTTDPRECSFDDPSFRQRL